MGSGRALASRILQPVPVFGNAAGLVVLGVSLIGAVVLGIKISWLVALALFPWVLFALTLIAAYRLQRERDRGPSLSFGEPIVTRPHSVPVPAGGALNPGWRMLEGAIVIRVPVINERGAGDADDIHAVLTFAGEKLDLEEPAQWSEFSDPKKFADSPKAITIRGNGQPYELDLCIVFPDDQDERAYVWNRDSMAAGGKAKDFRLGQDEFKIKVAVRGSHPRAEIEQTWRVWARIFPEIVPEGELFGSEQAIKETEEDWGQRLGRLSD